MNEIRTRITDDEVARLPLAAGRHQLLEEILRTAPTSYDAPGPRRAAPVLAVAGAAAAVAAVAVLTVGAPWAGDASRTGSDTAGVAGATGTGPTVLALLDAPGWRLESISAWSASYRGDGPTLEIDAYPAEQRRERLEGYADLAAPSAATVVGQPARVWSYSPTDHVAVRASEGSRFLVVRGQGLDAAAFGRALDALVPASAVLPTPTGATVADRDRLLGRWQRDLASPSGVDVLDPHLPGLTDQQSTAVTVLRGYACGWVADYVTASGAGAERDAVLAGMQQLVDSPAALAARGTPAPGEVDELLAGMRARVAPDVLVARCRVIQGG